LVQISKPFGKNFRKPQGVKFFDSHSGDLRRLH